MELNPENLEPKPKNPTIAGFFRNIGYADQLGSGVRKLFLYSKPYGGADPTFVEDDVFRITVSLDHTLGSNLHEPQNELRNEPQNEPQNSRQKNIVAAIKENQSVSIASLCQMLSVSRETVKRELKKLNISWDGPSKTGHWIINEK